MSSPSVLAACRGLAVIALLSLPRAAPAQQVDEASGCPVWDRFQAARRQADATAAAWHKVVIPAELGQKIERLLIQAALDNPGINFRAAFDSVRGQLDAAEQAQLVPWYAARAARELADAALKRASDEFTAASNARDKALAEATKTFEAEQAWLESEKRAIQSIPRDGAYLDRVAAITARLKAAYAKMKADLEPHRACFSDVRTFLDDKDERLARIDKLDAEIARRRAGGAATQPTDATATVDAGLPAPGEPPPPGPLGDWYVCDGPELVRPWPGKFTKVDVTGFTYERDVDGKRYAAGVAISKPPPLRVRGHQRVEIVIKASGDPKAPVDGNWECNNTVAGQIPSSNGCSNIPNFKSIPDSSTGVVRFYFGCGQNAFIRMYAGEYDSRDGTRMDVIWRYRKE